MTAADQLTVLIADDEPLLVDALQHELQIAWPELCVVGTAHNGPDAVQKILDLQPTVVFLDIQMPGHTGLEVAESVMEDWPMDGSDVEPPIIVFATAYDHYAIKAFETAAADYLVKPVTQKRLALTVARLKKQLQCNPLDTSEALAKQLHQLISQEQQASTSQPKKPLVRIQASVGDQIRVIAVEEVILFESSDKYTSVHTIDGETLIREPLKKLLPQLDPTKFEQVHRGAIVNMDMIESARRDETGKITLRLKGTNMQPVVSRVYRHLFQPM